MSGGPIREMEYSRRSVRGADYLVGTCGTGTAVLLLHGFPQTHYCWRHVVPTLSQRHRVVVTDLRGYGATTAPPVVLRGRVQQAGDGPRSRATDGRARVQAVRGRRPRPRRTRRIQDGCACRKYDWGSGTSALAGHPERHGWRRRLIRRSLPSCRRVARSTGRGRSVCLSRSCTGCCGACSSWVCFGCARSARRSLRFLCCATNCMC
jgi:alpha/beta hydrolase fold